ncbi:MAG TPA: hypothetical protein VN493_07580 [Thermoanaerobaculia bacterium]|nr:hypothetical protein [Thermoanaerobaculia bacterium]
MKTRNLKQLGWVLALCLLLPAAAHAGNETPKYSIATISVANSTVNLIPSTAGSGNVRGIKCIFPSNAGGASVKILFTVDGGAASSFIIDPTDLERESSGAGKFLSGWIPMDIEFLANIQVQLNNTLLGTAPILCFASWGLN